MIIPDHFAGNRRGDPTWSPVSNAGGYVGTAGGHVGPPLRGTGKMAGGGDGAGGGHIGPGGDHMGAPQRRGRGAADGGRGDDACGQVRELPERRSIRLRGYDYSRAGCYFITICTQNRRHYFGEIVDGVLRGRPPYNGGAGERAGAGATGWAGGWAGEGATTWGRPYRAPHAMVETWLLKLADKFADVAVGPYVVMPNHIHAIIRKTGDGAGVPVGDVVGWFKTMTTNEYIRGVGQGMYEPFDKRLWQRNYYEHIIRNERSYRNIAQYIAANPARWERDSLNAACTPAGAREEREEGV